MVLEVIIKRRSVRKYKPDPISDDDILSLLKAAEMAPVSDGDHTLQYLVITEQETKKQLQTLVGQEFVGSAPLLILPVVDVDRSPESVADLAVACENIMLEAASLELGTVWKNIEERCKADIRKILGIPDNYCFTNFIVVGKPAEQTKNHYVGTSSVLKKIHHEKW